ncbi:MAG: peptide ABC transporter substrate-binding protein [Alphaproteobacteria bacterium]|nr:peptide ABC transporter substrate-binding protein [Alphaproteobacteria bacterium]
MSGFPLSRRHLIRAAGSGAALAAAPRLSRAQADRSLRLRARYDIQVLDPYKIVNRAEYDILSAATEKLVEIKPGKTWDWALGTACEEIEYVDATHIRFRLVKDRPWTNGFGTLTAHDVKYSYERILAPDSIVSAEWVGFIGVEVVDDLNGVLVTDGPMATLFTSAAPWIGGPIMCKAAMEAAGGFFDGPPSATSGPYQITEWTPEQRTVLTPSPVWNGDPVQFDKITVLSITEDKTAELAYLAGELDYTTIAVSSIPTYRDGTLPPNTKLEIRPTTGFSWLGMNMEHPPYNNEKVRWAIQYAIDRPAIIEAAYFGAGPLSVSLIAPGVLGWRDLEPTQRDLEKARALLAEAGFADGFKTRVAIMDATDQRTSAQIIQANLAEIGIDCQIDVYDGGTYWDLGLEEKGEAWKDLELVLQQWTSSNDPNTTTTWFTPEQIGYWNWQRWNSPEYGKLNKQAIAETDAKKRDAMYARMMELMRDSAAFVNITHEPQAALYTANIDPHFLPDLSVLYRHIKWVGA